MTQLFGIYADGKINAVASITNPYSGDTILDSLNYKRATVGNAILQKSYTIDCITHKRVKNNGEKNKYIVHDCHPAIIDRDTYNRVQQELAKRGAIKKRSAKSRTELGQYSSKYALTDILICGECGTAYRRVTWTSHGHKRIVWRCISRLDHGSKYCKHSPSISEEKLQEAIVRALNTVYSRSTDMLAQMEKNILMVIGDEGNTKKKTLKIKKRIDEIEEERDDLVRQITSGEVSEDALDSNFESLNDEESYLKSQLDDLQNRAKLSDERKYALMAVGEELRKHDCHLEEYDDVTVRKVIEVIRVLSKTEVQIIFKDGHEMNVTVEK